MSLSRNSIQYNNGITLQSTFLKDEVEHEGDWLRFSKIKYLDPKGREKTWEAVTRLTRGRNSDTDSCASIAIYRRMLHYDVIVLVRQYRPALDAYTIEFPSGLVENGESCKEAALRELEEETGWHGEVTHMSHRLAVDPACSSSITRYATVKVNGDSVENTICNKTAQTEFIDLVMIPVAEIHEKLDRLAKEGNIIDSRVEAFAIGLQMGMKFSKDAEIDAVSTLQAILPLDGSCVRTGWRKGNI